MLQLFRVFLSLFLSYCRCVCVFTVRILICLIVIVRLAIRWRTTYLMSVRGLYSLFFVYCICMQWTCVNEFGPYSPILNIRTCTIKLTWNVTFCLPLYHHNFTFIVVIFILCFFVLFCFIFNKMKARRRKKLNKTFKPIYFTANK